MFTSIRTTEYCKFCQSANVLIHFKGDKIAFHYICAACFCQQSTSDKNQKLIKEKKFLNN